MFPCLSIRDTRETISERQQNTGGRTVTRHGTAATHNRRSPRVQSSRRHQRPHNRKTRQEPTTRTQSAGKVHGNTTAYQRDKLRFTEGGLIPCCELSPYSTHGRPFCFPQGTAVSHQPCPEQDRTSRGGGANKRKHWVLSPVPGLPLAAPALLHVDTPEVTTSVWQPSPPTTLRAIRQRTGTALPSCLPLALELGLR